MQRGMAADVWGVGERGEWESLGGFFRATGKVVLIWHKG